MTDIYGFYAAYIADLTLDESLGLMGTPAENIEPELISLAASKLDIDEKLATNLRKFRHRVERDFEEWLELVKDTAIRARVPLRVELMDLIHKSHDAIGHQAAAQSLVNYRDHADWAGKLMELTENAGADVIIETGGQDTLGQSIAAAAVNGRIAVIGVTPGQKSPIPDYVSLLIKNVAIRGIANGSREMFLALIRAIESNEIKTVVAKTFKFDDAPQAIAFFAAAQHLGKVLIEFDRS